MKNKEKFRKEIIDIALGTGTIAVIKKTGKPNACKETICSECIFHCMRNKECSALAKEWAENEYTEPPIDWNKVPKDTPILVKETESAEWCKRYYANEMQGSHVGAFADGATSWSDDGEKRITFWKYAKLAI